MMSTWETANAEGSVDSAGAAIDSAAVSTAVSVVDECAIGEGPVHDDVHEQVGIADGDMTNVSGQILHEDGREEQEAVTDNNNSENAEPMGHVEDHVMEEVTDVAGNATGAFDAASAAAAATASAAAVSNVAIDAAAAGQASATAVEEGVTATDGAAPQAAPLDPATYAGMQQNALPNITTPGDATSAENENDADRESDSQRKKEENATFPQKLMEVLSEENEALCKDICMWLPHGKGFIIADKKRFAAEILPRFFKKTKYTSFTRKLNRWNFVRVTRGPETGAYYHPLFQKGNARLCSQMTCINAKTSQQLQPMNPIALGLHTGGAASSAGLYFPPMFPPVMPPLPSNSDTNDPAELAKLEEERQRYFQQQFQQQQQAFMAMHAMTQQQQPAATNEQTDATNDKNLNENKEGDANEGDSKDASGNKIMTQLDPSATMYQQQQHQQNYFAMLLTQQQQHMAAAMAQQQQQLQPQKPPQQNGGVNKDTSTAPAATAPSTVTPVPVPVGTAENNGETTTMSGTAPTPAAIQGDGAGQNNTIPPASAAMNVETSTDPSHAASGIGNNIAAQEATVN